MYTIPFVILMENFNLLRQLHMSAILSPFSGVKLQILRKHMTDRVDGKVTFETFVRMIW